MFNQNRESEVMGDITTVGIDLAKNTFSVHDIDESVATRAKADQYLER